MNQVNVGIAVFVYQERDSMDLVIFGAGDSEISLAGSIRKAIDSMADY